MTTPQFFGYGSLVNLRTHAYPFIGTAQIPGWRRIWRSVDGVPQAVLSVTQDSTCTLDGIVAQVPNGDWAALDKRERLYVRYGLPDKTAIYEVMENLSDAPAPILRSYLDVVAQGYHDHFGPDGVQHFFETTAGWHPIADDRAAPRYPRSVKVPDEITALVDHHLAVTVKQPMQPPL
ncbi:MAG: gamma-glutamylcyclotransferase family protein [Pseudomonadota bacterium]